MENRLPEWDGLEIYQTYVYVICYHLLSRKKVRIAVKSVKCKIALGRLITLSPSNRYRPPTPAHARTHGFPAKRLALCRPFAKKSCGASHRASLWSHDLSSWSHDIFLANDWFIFSQSQLEARH